jgi:two-component sensor histidine kinase
LDILKNGVVKNIDVEDGLSSNTVLSVVSDKEENIYLSTFKGVNILYNLSSDSFFIRTITQKDGLAADDCNREASLLDDEGNLWFGTERGVSIYNPEKDNPVTTSPKIYITGLQIYNHNYPMDKFLENPVLSYDKNYLNFIYTGINLSSPEKIKFKYLLSGIDIEWVENNDNAVQYTNLDDGEYVFQVKAGNEWGYWSEPAKISFIINPAWWETWWFYLLVIISLASLLIFIISYRYKHLLAIEKVRLKISTDLHDDIGAGLSELSFLGEIIKHKLPESASSLVKKELTKIGEVSRGLINSMSDIVWLVTPKTDSLFDLIVRLRDLYADVITDRNISFEVKNLEGLKKVSLKMESRQHIYLIFKEAINNCLKHSNFKNIILTINQSGNKIIIKLRDDGRGFNEGKYFAGNGLKNIKERAKLIGGHISITSSPSNGCTIEFTGKNLE